jgi:membrane fusion protein (multidrug efflux system)
MVVRYREAAAVARQELATAHQASARLVVRSPLAGRLAVDRPLAPGSEIEAATPLARVVTVGGGRVEAFGAASDRTVLTPALPVRVLAAGGDRVLATGTLSEVSPELDAGGALRVVASVADGAGLPAVGEGVEVEVSLGEHPRALVVPSRAVVVGEGDTVVFVVERQRGLVARRRAVQTGLGGGGVVEILDGLHEGDRVVVDGAGTVADGSPVAETSTGGGAAR